MTALIICACAVLNRLAGTKEWKTWVTAEPLPGRPVFYAAPVMGLIAWLAGHGYLVAFMVALGYLVYRMPSWGYLNLLGRDHERQPTEFEEFLLMVCRGNIHGAHTLRHSMAWIGTVAAAGPVGILVGPISTLMYETAWRIAPKNPIWIAEVAVGAIWGVMIAGGVP